MKKIVSYVIVGVMCVCAGSAYGRVRHSHVWAIRAFPPTYDSLRLQNQAADAMELPRIRTKAELRELIDDGELVPIVSSPVLRVHIPRDRAYLRPEAAAFLMTLAREYATTFGHPLQVNSAVRTVEFQRRLRRINRNAAPTSGERASVHSTGVAFDLQRRLPLAEVRFLQLRLLYYHYGPGIVIVEEERRHPCFHVVVTGGNL